jgi:hypothetical protein
MAVMGERLPEAWMVELHRMGRVVFPVRRRTIRLRMVLITLYVGVIPANSWYDMMSEGGGGLVLALASFATGVVVLGYSTWQLITQRPHLVIDHEGIRRGRKRFMPWTEVGAIGIPTGQPFQSVSVLPANVWAKDLRLDRDHVKDIPTLATWLETLLAEKRAQAQNSPQTG